MTSQATMKPLVFVGSSTEGLPVAEALSELLGHEAEVVLWSQGTFKLSRAIMEDLEHELDRSDFAIMALTADDLTTSRDQAHAAPRDNVLFELGLFMGRLGRDRCYFIHEATHPIKLPSDLLGITAATYRPDASGDLLQSLGEPAGQIRSRLQDLGLRPKLDRAAIDVFKQRRAFSNGIAGQWWQRMKPDDASALSYMTVVFDAATGGVRLRGQAYGLDTRLVANWESDATAMKVAARKVFYYWTGWHPDEPNHRYEGFGEFRFREARGIFSKGGGLFSNTNLSDIASTIRKSFSLRRVTAEELKIMEGTDTERMRHLIEQTLDNFL
jgi:hypothetical protein